MVESKPRSFRKRPCSAVMTGHRGFQPVIDAIIRLAERAAKDPRDFAPERSRGRVEKAVADDREAELRAPTRSPPSRSATRPSTPSRKVDGASSRKAVEPQFSSAASAKRVQEAWQAKVVRWNILDTGQAHRRSRREDGAPDHPEVGVLPRTHGSALFTRGETQALVVATLGTGDDEQYHRRAGRHQRSASCSTTTSALFGRRNGPRVRRSRREIGHGKLAWRAIRPMLPRRPSSPRPPSSPEITESNGSSSMATVCGSSLALMDAGVP